MDSGANEELRSARTLALILPIFFLGLYFCFAPEGPVSKTDAGDRLLRLAMVIALGGGFVLSIIQVFKSALTFHSTWWNIGGALDNPTWDDVRDMTIGERSHDPLLHVPEPDLIQTALKTGVGIAIATTLAAAALSLISDGPILPRILLSGQPGGNGLSANLTALLALIAALASIHFTYRQLQAKVRADSRQAWIDKLRNRIARFIALAKPPPFDDPKKIPKRRQEEFTTRRIEMELMLNPSEKDHRLLMYLSIRIAFFKNGEKEFREIQDVQNIRAAIGVDDENFVYDPWRPLFDPIPDESEPERQKAEFSKLIGYTLRLSHVVLKREWERVKATR